MIVTKIELSDMPYLRIKPLADVHYGNSYCDIKAFKSFLDDADDNTYFLGVGDILDSIIVKDKRYSKSADATESDAIINAVTFDMIDILTPYRDKILGLGRGNHEQTVVDKCSVDPIDIMCRVLKIRYLGYSYQVKISFGKNSIQIYAHHGWGGSSRTRGGSMTKYGNDTVNYDADIYLYGHDHKLQHDCTEELAIRNNKWVSKSRLVCLCGSFLKTRSSTIDAPYSEIKALPPTPIGGLNIYIKPTSNGLDMSVIISRYSHTGDIES